MNFEVTTKQLISDEIRKRLLLTGAVGHDRVKKSLEELGGNFKGVG
jgi:hypothetical protein